LGDPTPSQLGINNKTNYSLMSAMGVVLILIALRYFFYAPGLLSDALLKHSLSYTPLMLGALRSPSRHSGREMALSMVNQSQQFVDGSIDVTKYNFFAELTDISLHSN
jgi:hypothetical protein